MSDKIICNSFDHYKNKFRIVEETHHFYWGYVGSIFSDEEPQGWGKDTTDHTAIDEITGKRHPCTILNLTCPECGQVYELIFNPKGGSWIATCDLGHDEVKLMGWN